MESLISAKDGQEAEHKKWIDEIIRPVNDVEDGNNSWKYYKYKNFWVDDEKVIDSDIISFLYTVSLQTARESLKDWTSARFPKPNNFRRNGYTNNMLEVHRKFFMGIIKKRSNSTTGTDSRKEEEAAAYSTYY